MADRAPWRPYSVAAFTQAFMAKLPRGEIWPRSPASTLYAVVQALMVVVARWSDRVGSFLLTEAFPPTALTTLSDWERVLGLPDKCLLPSALTVAERQAAVRNKLADRPGRLDRYAFLEIAEALGYDITITEYRPAMCGVTQTGVTVGPLPDFDASSTVIRADMTTVDASWTEPAKLIVRGAGCGTPYMRFVWRVDVSGPRLTWFAVGAGGGRAGQDPHLRIRRAEDLECLFTRLKPAHTHLIFSYQGV